MFIRATLRRGGQAADEELFEVCIVAQHESKVRSCPFTSFESLREDSEALACGIRQLPKGRHTTSRACHQSTDKMIIIGDLQAGKKPQEQKNKLAKVADFFDGQSKRLDCSLLGRRVAQC